MLGAPPQVDVFAACYDLLARFYLNGPGAVRPERLPAVGPLLEGLAQVDPGWPARTEELLTRTERPSSLEQAQTEYLEFLALPVPGRYVPPYASVYLDDGTLWGQSTIKILAVYELEGLSWQRGRFSQRASVTAPDHVGVEFAFLAIVSSRSPRGLSETRRQQQLGWFLSDHLGQWLPAYRDVLAAAGAGPTLEDWTTWGIDVVQADLARRTQGGG